MLLRKDSERSDISDYYRVEQRCEIKGFKVISKEKFMIEWESVGRFAQAIVLLSE